MQFLTITLLTFGLCATTGGQTSQPAKSATRADTDITFLKTAISGNLAEIKLGQLAEKNASSQAVKQFGERMVTDHNNLLEQAKSVARVNGITAPASTSAKDQATYKALEAETGPRFDKAYITRMLSDHRHDIAECEREANAGGNPDMRALANKALPVLREHLRLAENAARQLGIPTTPGERPVC